MHIPPQAASGQGGGRKEEPPEKIPETGELPLPSKTPSTAKHAGKRMQQSADSPLRGTVMYHSYTCIVNTCIKNIQLRLFHSLLPVFMIRYFFMARLLHVFFITFLFPSRAGIPAADKAAFLP